MTDKDMKILAHIQDVKERITQAHIRLDYAYTKIKEIERELKP